jgi:hypothetical protein
MDSDSSLAIGFFVLSHFLRAQLHLVFIEGLLAALEDYRWRWVRITLTSTWKSAKTMWRF